MDLSKFLKKWVNVRAAEKALASGPKGGFHPELLSKEAKAAKEASDSILPSLSSKTGDTPAIIPREGIPEDLVKSRLQNLENDIPTHESYLKDNPEIKQFQKGLDEDEMLRQARQDAIKKSLNKAAGLAGAGILGGAALSSDEAEAGPRLNIMSALAKLTSIYGNKIPMSEIAKLSKQYGIRNVHGHLVLDRLGLPETLAGSNKAIEIIKPESKLIELLEGKAVTDLDRAYFSENPGVGGFFTSPGKVIEHNKRYIKENPLDGRQKLLDDFLKRYPNQTMETLNPTIRMREEYDPLPRTSFLLHELNHGTDELKLGRGFLGSEREFPKSFSLTRGADAMLNDPEIVGFIKKEVPSFNGTKEELENLINSGEFKKLMDRPEFPASFHYNANSWNHFRQNPRSYELQEAHNLANNEPIITPNLDELVEKVSKNENYPFANLQNYLKSKTPDKIAAGIGAAALGGAALGSDDAEAAPKIPSSFGKALTKVVSKEAPLEMTEAARLARAKEMGFDMNNPMYHATDTTFERFKPSERGYQDRGIYLANSPHRAESFLDRIVERGDRVVRQRDLPGINTMPVFIKGKQFEGPLTVRSLSEQAGISPADAQKIISDKKTIPEILQSLGFTGTSDFQGSEVNIFDPKNIRSKFAKFDPSKADSSDITAGLAGAGVLGGAAALGGNEAQASVPKEEPTNWIDESKKYMEENTPLEAGHNALRYVGNKYNQYITNPIRGSIRAAQKGESPLSGYLKSAGPGGEKVSTEDIVEGANIPDEYPLGKTLLHSAIDLADPVQLAPTARFGKLGGLMNAAGFLPSFADEDENKR